MRSVIHSQLTGVFRSRAALKDKLIISNHMEFLLVSLCVLLLFANLLYISQNSLDSEFVSYNLLFARKHINVVFLTSLFPLQEFCE